MVIDQGSLIPYSMQELEIIIYMEVSGCDLPSLDRRPTKLARAKTKSSGRLSRYNKDQFWSKGRPYSQVEGQPGQNVYLKRDFSMIRYQKHKAMSKKLRSIRDYSTIDNRIAGNIMIEDDDDHSIPTRSYTKHGRRSEMVASDEFPKKIELTSVYLDHHRAIKSEA